MGPQRLDRRDLDYLADRLGPSITHAIVYGTGTAAVNAGRMP